MAAHKKPISARKIEGTYRAEIHGLENSIESGAPEKPLWLSGAAGEEWSRVSKMLENAGYLAKTDGMALSIYCELAAEFAGYPSDFPASKLSQLRMLMNDLGLTPVSRAKMPTAQKEDKNSFEGLMN